MQCLPLVQNLRVKRIQWFCTEDLCFKISSGGVQEKSWPAGVCLSVCMCVYMYASLSKHSRLLSPNGWSDRDGRIFVRPAETTLRRWCQLQTNQVQVARDTLNRANPSKKALAKTAGQANGRNRLKLGELNPLGVTDSVACAARATVT